MLNANQLNAIFSLNCTLEDYYLALYTKMGKHSEVAMLRPNNKIVSMGKPTKFGWKLLKTVEEAEQWKETEIFKEIWNFYPETDEINGFPKTRTTVRGNKQKALEAYYELLIKYTEEEIKEGVITNINKIKAECVFSNKLSWLVGLERFLREKHWKTTSFSYKENDAFL